jgi:hypothetical protein
MSRQAKSQKTEPMSRQAKSQKAELAIGPDNFVIGVRGAL